MARERLSTINIRPGVSILSVLQHLNYKEWFALAEFVDNSIQSYLSRRKEIEKLEGKGFVLRVEIDLDPSLRQIRIRDNAAGIESSAYERAFRPAEVPPDSSGLAEFGMGMKSAACWFSPNWSVRSNAIGESEERTVIFNIREIVEGSVENIEVVSGVAAADRHGTEVILDDVGRFPRGRTLTKIRDHLSSIYRCFLRDNVLDLRWNGAPLTYNDPPILEAPDYHDYSAPSILWKKDVEIRLADGRSIDGFVAIRETASTAHAGLAIFRRRRLVLGSGDETYRPSDIFGASNTYSFQRVFGELHLHGFSGTHTKDGVQWDGAEDEFIGMLREAIRGKDFPLLQQAGGYRTGEDPRRSREQATEALAGAVDALDGDDTELIGLLADGDSPSDDEHPPPEEIPSNADDITNIRSILVGSEAWEIKITLSYDDAIKDWLRISNRPSAGDPQPRQLGLSISMVHPFMVQFGGNTPEQIEPLIRLGMGLALAEVLATDAGSKGPGSVRRNLNELLSLVLSRPS